MRDAPNYPEYEAIVKTLNKNAIYQKSNLRLFLWSKINYIRSEKEYSMTLKAIYPNPMDEMDKQAMIDQFLFLCKQTMEMGPEDSEYLVNKS